MTLFRIERLRIYCVIISIFTLLILLGLFFTKMESGVDESFVGKDVFTILTAMPKKDRVKLEYFFRELLQEDYFGFVLLGQKPMAIGSTLTKVNPFTCLWEKPSTRVGVANCFIPPLNQRFMFYFHEAISSNRIKFNRAYETWKKYEIFFPMKRFSILYENLYRDGCKNLSIVLINKKTFTQIVNDHIDDFKKVLNREVNMEKLLKETDVLLNHDGLLGILLGYGRENALWFYQNNNLFSEKERAEFYEKFHPKIAFTEELGSLWTEEELQNLSKQRISNGAIHSPNLDYVSLPTFRADFSSSETQALRENYLKTQQKIVEYYKDKDFLQTTLELLTSTSE